MSNELRPIDGGARIGHVHLKVSDLERALRFYCDVLGFEIQQRWGAQAAFISAGGYHHHIGLNTWESLRGSQRPHNCTGLFHPAVPYPRRRRRIAPVYFPSRFFIGAALNSATRFAVSSPPRSLSMAPAIMA